MNKNTHQQLLTTALEAFFAMLYDLQTYTVDHIQAQEKQGSCLTWFRKVSKSLREQLLPPPVTFSSDLHACTHTICNVLIKHCLHSRSRLGIVLYWCGIPCVSFRSVQEFHKLRILKTLQVFRQLQMKSVHPVIYRSMIVCKLCTMAISGECIWFSSLLREAFGNFYLFYAGFCSYIPPFLG